MTDSHSALHAKVRTLRPTGDEAKLDPGCIFIAILKNHKRSTEVLEHSDILWKKCQMTDQLAATYEAYLKDSKVTGELGLQFDGKAVTSTTIVGDLNWRKDDFIVLETVETSDLTTEPALGPPENPVLHTNTSPANLTSQHYEAMDTESITSDVATTLPTPPQDIPLKEISIQFHLSGNHSQEQCARSPSDQAWLDFACERRAFLQKQHPFSAPSEVAEIDDRIRQEFVELNLIQKDLVDRRASQIGAVLGDDISARAAFW